MAKKAAKKTATKPRQTRLKGMDDPQMDRLKALGEDWIEKRRLANAAKVEQDAVADEIMGVMRKYSLPRVTLDTSGKVIRYSHVSKEKLKLENKKGA